MANLGVESEEETSLVGQTVAGKFQIESLLGSGSMGRVYRARHIQLEQTVALKVMSAEYAGEKSLVARFEREARASFAVAHPNIIRVIDYGKDTTGLVYLAMEFVDGGDLAGLIFRAAPLHKNRIAHLMRQALAGVAAAHDAGIVHRDLKPENLMIATVMGDDGVETEVVKVCDFGIAKISDVHPSSERLERGRRRLTEIGLIIGTPEYMPPEQARGEKVDARSDIYALGVVMYELLTGTLPFVANTPTETIIKQISEEPARPSAGRTGIDPRLEEICLKALKKRADDRFQTAREMRGALGFAIGMRESMEELPPHVDPAPPAAVSVKPAKDTLVSSRAFPVNPPAPASQVPTQVPIVTANEPAPPTPNRARAAYVVGAALVVAAGAAVVARLGAPHPEPIRVTAPEVTAKTPTGAPPSAPATPASIPVAANPGDSPPAAANSPPSIPTPASAPPPGAIAKPLSGSSPPVAARPPTKGTLAPAAPDPTPSAAPVPAPAPEPVVTATPPPPAVAVVPPPAPPPVQAVQAAPAPPPVDPNAARAIVTGIDNVQGALKRDFDKAVGRASGHFGECYQADVRAASPASASSLAGAGTLHIETDDSGTITSAHANGPLSASGARCLERSVVGVKVPNVDTGQASADISIAFTLR